MSAEQGRPYVHKKCGQVTLITGSDFVGLCNPFEPCMGTICASCGGPDSTSQFAWADTQEPISEYRARLRAEAPASLKIWNYVISPLVGGGIGGAVGAALDAKNPAMGTDWSRHRCARDVPVHRPQDHGSTGSK